MFRRRIAILVTTLFVCLATSPAWAAGIGFTPGRLEFSDTHGTLHRTLYVINSGSDKASYQVYAEPEYEAWFRIEPNQFTLDPSEHREVAVDMSPAAAPGDHRTNICVVAFSENGNVDIGAGAKVPVHIELASRLSEITFEETPDSATIPTKRPEAPAPDPVIAEQKSTSNSPMSFGLWAGLAAVATAGIPVAITFVMLRRRKRALSA